LADVKRSIGNLPAQREPLARLRWNVGDFDRHLVDPKALVIDLDLALRDNETPGSLRLKRPAEAGFPRSDPVDILEGIMGGGSSAKDQPGNLRRVHARRAGRILDCDGVSIGLS